MDMYKKLAHGLKYAYRILSNFMSLKYSLIESNSISNFIFRMIFHVSSFVTFV